MEPLNSIEAIKKRLLGAPGELILKPAKEPVMVVATEGPMAGSLIKKGTEQRVHRMDMVLKSDPKLVSGHFHITKENPFYNPDWEAHATFFMNAANDIRFLLNELEKKNG